MKKSLIFLLLLTTALQSCTVSERTNYHHTPDHISSFCSDLVNSSLGNPLGIIIDGLYGSSDFKDYQEGGLTIAQKPETMIWTVNMSDKGLVFAYEAAKQSSSEISQWQISDFVLTYDEGNGYEAIIKSIAPVSYSWNLSGLSFYPSLNGSFSVETYFNGEKIETMTYNFKNGRINS